MHTQTPDAVVSQAGEVMWTEQTSIPFNAAGAASSSGTALLSTKVFLTGTGSALSSGNAALGVRASINAVGSASSIGAASLSATQALSVAGVSSSGGVATLIATRGLVATGVSLSAGTALLTAISPYLDQYAYRWALDDAVEGSATWANPEDTPITVTKGDRRRVRIGVDATGNPPPFGARVQYRRKDIADSWRDVQVCDPREFDTGFDEGFW